jgi:hypothetical protein
VSSSWSSQADNCWRTSWHPMTCRVLKEFYPLVIKTPYLIKSGAAYIIFLSGYFKSLVIVVAREGPVKIIFVIREKSSLP